MESSKTSDNVNEDHSELFEEDNECILSFSHESQHSRSSAAMPKVRHADRISSEMKRDAGTCCDSGSKFRVAVKKVQTMQAATKTFSNSQQMREAVYEDWLAGKLALLQKSERLKHEERMKNEAALKRKAVSIYVLHGCLKYARALVDQPAIRLKSGWPVKQPYT